MTSDIPLLGFVDQKQMTSVTIKTADCVREQVVPLRVVFGRGRKRVAYDYLPFKRARTGTDEVELFCDEIESFALRLVLVRSEAKGSMHFEQRLLGSSITAIDKYIRALRALAETRSIEVYDLKSGKSVLRTRVHPPFPASHLVDDAKFFALAARVNDFFNVTLKLGRIPNNEDASSLRTLAWIMEGTGTPAAIEVTVTKGATDDGIVRALRGEIASLRLEHGGLDIPFLGSIVKTGPFTLHARARLVNRDKAHREWCEACAGSPVTLEWEPVEPATLTRGGS
jgi:hypothetical protein